MADIIFTAPLQIKATLYLDSTNASLPNAWKSAIIISTKALLNLTRSDNNDNRSNYQAT